MHQFIKYILYFVLPVRGGRIFRGAGGGAGGVSRRGRERLYLKPFVTAERSARKYKAPPIVLASDRDPFASDLGASTFVSRALSPRVSFPVIRWAYPRSHALGVVLRRRGPELGGSCGDAPVLLVTGEDICGSVVAPRKCLGPALCWRNIYLWCPKYWWCLLFVDSRIPLGLLDPHGLAFFCPCLPAESDCWLVELG